MIHYIWSTVTALNIIKKKVPYTNVDCSIGGDRINRIVKCSLYWPWCSRNKERKGGPRNFALVLLVLVPQRLDRMTDDKVKKKANKNSWQIPKKVRTFYNVSMKVELDENLTIMLKIYCCYVNKFNDKLWEAKNASYWQSKKSFKNYMVL